MNSLTGLFGRRSILARWRRQRWRTRSAAGSTPPAAARTCSSAGAGSWMTGPATWAARVESRRPEQRSMAFPPGITVAGATLKWGGVVVDFGVHHLPLPGGAPAPKNPGSLPPPSPPPVRRHDAPCETGTRDADAPRGFTPEDLGNRCQPASNTDSRAQPGPQPGGLRPLREKRCGCQKRALLGEPPT